MFAIKVTGKSRATTVWIGFSVVAFVSIMGAVFGSLLYVALGKPEASQEIKDQDMHLWPAFANLLVIASLLLLICAGLAVRLYYKGQHVKQMSVVYQELADAFPEQIRRETQRIEQLRRDERAAEEASREQWKAEKTGELYDMIMDQVHRNKLGPGMEIPQSWREANPATDIEE